MEGSLSLRPLAPRAPGLETGGCWQVRARFRISLAAVLLIYVSTTKSVFLSCEAEDKCVLSLVASGTIRLWVVITSGEAVLLLSRLCGFVATGPSHSPSGVWIGSPVSSLLVYYVNVRGGK